MVDWNLMENLRKDLLTKTVVADNICEWLNGHSQCRESQVNNDYGAVVRQIHSSRVAVAAIKSNPESSEMDMLVRLKYNVTGFYQNDLRSREVHTSKYCKLTYYVRNCSSFLLHSSVNKLSYGFGANGVTTRKWKRGQHSWDTLSLPISFKRSKFKS